MPPAKLACKGCSLSKVKCDLEMQTSGTCSRCKRLGLQCVARGPSKRGRPHPSRDIARLGPAVRKLLAKESTPTIGTVATYDGDSQSDTVACNFTTLHIDKLVHQRDVRSAACKTLMAQLETASSRWAWLRHILYITQRARSVEGMANAMMTAHEMGFSLDEVQAAISMVDPEQTEPAFDPLPDFVREWYTGSQVSLTRTQSAGYVEWTPSPAFERLFGLSGKQAEGLITMLDSCEDRKQVVEVTGKLWSQISADSPDGVAQHVQYESPREIYISVRGQRMGPLKLRGRLVVRDYSLKTWSCINLAPASTPPLLDPPHPVATTAPPGLAASGAAGAPQPPGGGVAGASAQASLARSGSPPMSAAASAADRSDQDSPHLLGAADAQLLAAAAAAASAADSAMPPAARPDEPVEEADDADEEEAADDAESALPQLTASELDALLGPDGLLQFGTEVTVPLDQLLELVSEAEAATAAAAGTT